MIRKICNYAMAVGISLCSISLLIFIMGFLVEILKSELTIDSVMVSFIFTGFAFILIAFTLIVLDCCTDDMQ